MLGFEQQNHSKDASISLKKHKFKLKFSLPAKFHKGSR